MSELQLDPELIATLAALETHRVEFVLVGDIAHAIYDAGGWVSGVAIVPGDYGRNVDRLANALTAMHAQLGIAGRPDPRSRDWRLMDLRELAPCTFMTIYADVDLDFRPAGTTGYRDLFQDAERYDLAPGARPHVASLDDLDRIGRIGLVDRPEPAPLASASAPPPPPAAPPPPAIVSPDQASDDYDLDIWTDDEVRAIRACRIPF